MVRLCNDAGHRACNEFPIMARLRYAIGRTVSPAHRAEPKKKPYRRPSPSPSPPPSPRISRDFSTLRPTFRPRSSFLPSSSLFLPFSRIVRRSISNFFRLEISSLPIRSYEFFVLFPLPPFILFASFQPSVHPLPPPSTLSPALLDRRSFLLSRRFFSTLSRPSPANRQFPSPPRSFDLCPPLHLPIRDSSQLRTEIDLSIEFHSILCFFPPFLPSRALEIFPEARTFLSWRE